MAVLALVLAAVGVGVRFLRLPYDSVAPGEAHSLNRVVTVKGHQSYPPRGRLLSTTVSVRTGINPYEALAGWLDPSVDVLAEEAVQGDVPDAEYQKINQDAMADSKTTAKLIALRHLGFEGLTTGAEIVSVVPDYPASPQLRTGDVIVAVDGSTVKESGDAVAALTRHEPGDKAKVRLVRDGRPLELEAILGGGDRGTAVLGVHLTTKIDIPFDISIESGDVVGPSAGLAYALEVLDVLTPGELTGGVPVAVTGEVKADGKVGPIGGVAQKTVSVRRAGAKVFLVPKENLAEAKAHAGRGLQVRAVSTFEEALTALGSLRGSNALALGPPPPGH